MLTLTLGKYITNPEPHKQTNKNKNHARPVRDNILSKLPLETPLVNVLGHLLIGNKKFSPVDARYTAIKLIIRQSLCYNRYKCFSVPLILQSFIHTCLILQM